MLAPGSRSQHAEALIKPVDNVHWAGTETSLDNHPGYMDGAVAPGPSGLESVSLKCPLRHSKQELGMSSGTYTATHPYGLAMFVKRDRCN